MTEQSLAANAGAGGQVQATGEGDSGTTSTPTNAFVESLPEDIRSSEYLKSYQDAGALAKDYLDLRGKIPQVPESAEGYTLEYPDGFPKHMRLGDEFRKGFLEAGLSNDQVKRLNELHVGMVANRLAKINEAQDASIKELKNTWKADYDKNLTLINKVVTFAGGDELTRLVEMQVDGKRLGDHPVFLKAMHKIGSMLSEDQLVTGKSSKEEDLQRTPGGKPIFPSYKGMKQKR